MPARVRVCRVSESAKTQIVREGGDVGRKGAHRLTSCPLPPPSLLHSMQRGSSALMTFSGGPEHCGPSPSDTYGLPRHSGAVDGEGRGGERERERQCYHQGDSPEFPPLTQITTDFHHNTLSKTAL